LYEGLHNKVLSSPTGADPDRANGYGGTPLMLAAANGDPEVLR